MLQQLPHALPDLPAAGIAMDAQGIGDDGSHPLAGVQRRVRVLEDHLHVAADRPERAPGEPRDVLAVEDDRSAGQLLQPDDATAEGGFAAAGLADQAERLPGPDLDADVVDGVHPAHLALEHDPALDREVLLQMLDPQQHVPGRSYLLVCRCAHLRASGTVPSARLRHGAHDAPSTSSGWMVRSLRLRLSAGSKWQASV